MAGAFVAMADDATAAYWNPAGLPSGAFLSLLLDYQRPESWGNPARSDAPATNDSSIFTGLATNSTALSYYRLRTNQIERSIPPGAEGDPARKDQGGTATLVSLVTHHAALTGAQSLGPGVSFGTTFRYVRGSFGIAPGDPALSVGELLQQAEDLDGQGKNAWDVDLGLMLGSPTVRFGLVARNLRQPTFSAPNGESVRVTRHVRVGAAVRTVAGLRVATDIDLTRATTPYGDRRSLALGAEHWFGEGFALRGGARVNLEGDDSRPVGAFGLSVALTTGVYLDVQLTHGRDSIERGWGMAGRVGF